MKWASDQIVTDITVGFGRCRAMYEGGILIIFRINHVNTKGDYILEQPKYLCSPIRPQMDNITFKQLRNITEDEAREMLEAICYDDKEKPTK